MGMVLIVIIVEDDSDGDVSDIDSDIALSDSDEDGDDKYGPWQKLTTMCGERFWKKIGRVSLPPHGALRLLGNPPLALQ